MVDEEQVPANDEDPEIDVFDLWRAGKTLNDISELTGLDLKTVMTILKEKQKSIVQKGS